MNFDMVVFEDVDEADTDWEQYKEYSRYDDDYFGDNLVMASIKTEELPNLLNGQTLKLEAKNTFLML